MYKHGWDGELDEWIPEHWYADKILWMLMREPEANDANFLNIATRCIGKNADMQLVRYIVERYLPLYRELYYQSEALRKAGIVLDDHRDLVATVVALAPDAKD